MHATGESSTGAIHIWGKGRPLRYQTAQATRRGARGFAELNKVGPNTTGLTAGYVVR